MGGGRPGAPLHGGRQRQIRGAVPSHGARVRKFESISLHIRTTLFNMLGCLIGEIQRLFPQNKSNLPGCRRSTYLAVASLEPHSDDGARWPSREQPINASVCDPLDDCHAPKVKVPRGLKGRNSCAGRPPEDFASRGAKSRYFWFLLEPLDQLAAPTDSAKIRRRGGAAVAAVGALPNETPRCLTRAQAWSRRAAALGEDL